MAERLRGLVMFVCGLCAFLMSLYTGTMVKRWWTMRVNGLGAMWRATTDLCLLLSLGLPSLRRRGAAPAEGRGPEGRGRTRKRSSSKQQRLTAGQHEQRKPLLAKLLEHEPQKVKEEKNEKEEENGQKQEVVVVKEKEEKEKEAQDETASEFSCSSNKAKGMSTRNTPVKKCSSKSSARLKRQGRNQTRKSFHEDLDELDVVAVKRIARYGRLSVSLAFESESADCSLDSLRSKGLLTEREQEILRDVIRWRLPSAVWGWIMALVTDLETSGRIRNGAVAGRLYAQCDKGREGAHVIWTYLTTQLPLSYVHIVGFVVKINNILMALSMGSLMALDIQDRQWVPLVSHVICVFIFPLLYSGVLIVGEEIANPFGDDSNDFPRELYDEMVGQETSSTWSSIGHLPALCHCDEEAKEENHAPTCANYQPCSDSENKYQCGNKHKTLKIFTERTEQDRRVEEKSSSASVIEPRAAALEKENKWCRPGCKAGGNQSRQGMEEEDSHVKIHVSSSPEKEGKPTVVWA
eukprot:GHVT01024262.1.p1 GENE.GHVT01024262.1~~GHVT01024262.1.p1  ORF type:complete len:609 (+),score=151.28 GHVT01024262.1:265-1827(+)